MAWGIGLVLATGLMAAPGALAQAPATPGTPPPPTVEVPQPPEPPEVNPPAPPAVEVPAPPKPVHVDPPQPPDVGIPDPPKSDKPDKPKGDKDSQPKDDSEAAPVAVATAKPTETHATRPKPTRRLHVDRKAERLTAARTIRSKPAASSPRSVRTVAAVHVASATAAGPTSLRTVSDPINAAPHPRRAAAHATTVAAEASPPQPHALTLNGSRERIEITLAFALLFPALVAFMIGRALGRGADTKDRYHL